MSEVFNKIQKFIRPATPEDEKNLPIYSYSRLDTFRQCQYRFYLKYRKLIPTNEKSVALEVGTFCHAILEQRGNAAIDGVKLPDAEEMRDEWDNDYVDLKKAFENDWLKPDKEKRTYEDKFEMFWGMYDYEMKDSNWKVVACEQEFNFVFGEKFILHGFIDRLDRNNNGDYKVIDYKTAAHIYPKSERDKSMQMFIYAMGVYCMYGKFPSEFEYDFVFFGEKRGALEPGEESFEACFEELKRLFSDIYEKDGNKNFIPHRSPLCWWCPYGKDKRFEAHDRCQYYSEWTPTDRDFRNHKNIIEGTFNAETESEKTKQKIIW